MELWLSNLPVCVLRAENTASTINCQQILCSNRSSVTEIVTLNPSLGNDDGKYDVQAEKPSRYFEIRRWVSQYMRTCYG
jgi:hypothetical protein